VVGRSRDSVGRSVMLVGRSTTPKRRPRAVERSMSTERDDEARAKNATPTTKERVHQTKVISRVTSTNDVRAWGD